MGNIVYRWIPTPSSSLEWANTLRTLMEDAGHTFVTRYTIDSVTHDIFAITPKANALTNYIVFSSSQSSNYTLTITVTHAYNYVTSDWGAELVYGTKFSRGAGFSSSLFPLVSVVTPKSFFIGGYLDYQNRYLAWFTQDYLVDPVYTITNNASPGNNVNLNLDSVAKDVNEYSNWVIATPTLDGSQCATLYGGSSSSVTVDNLLIPVTSGSKLQRNNLRVMVMQGTSFYTANPSIGFVGASPPANWLSLSSNGASIFVPPACVNSSSPSLFPFLFYENNSYLSFLAKDYAFVLVGSNNYIPLEGSTNVLDNISDAYHNLNTITLPGGGWLSPNEYANKYAYGIYMGKFYFSKIISNTVDVITLEENIFTTPVTQEVSIGEDVYFAVAQLPSHSSFPFHGNRFLSFKLSE